MKTHSDDSRCERDGVVSLCKQPLLRRQSDTPASDRQGNTVIRLSDQLGQSPHAEFPVKIFTLGRFSLLANDEPVAFGRKTPKKPLELLKAIIALGGRNVGLTELAANLWPDVDGDSAQRSLDTTLHRLRKILPDAGVLVVKEGKVTLDPGYCWVDVWEFERLLGMARRISRADRQGIQAGDQQIITDRLLGMYQDHFLGSDEVTSWSVSLRERLRDKYIHALLDLGQYWARIDSPDRAIDCYRKGIEVDDLVEVFYQRLIECCLTTGRYSEGMAAYRHCRQVLSIVLGLQPEPGTEVLYEQLKTARYTRETA